MDSQTRSIIVIEVTIMKKSQFIRKLNQRQDGKLQPELTYRLEEAKEFDSREDADASLKLLHNPYDRPYQVLEALIECEKKPSVVDDEELK